MNTGCFGILDNNLGGVTTQSLTSSNVTLTATEAQNLVIRLTGTISANITITTPGIGFYWVENVTTGAFTVTLQFTGAVGSTLVIAQGYRVPVIIDGTNGVRNGSGVGAASSAYNLYDNVSVHGADIASASTINLTTATGNLVDVTGTTTITAITLTEGYERTVRFTGALILTNGASLVLPGAANITTVAGDFAIFRGYAAGVVRCVAYQRGAAAPWADTVASDSARGTIETATTAELAAASSTTVAVTPGRMLYHPAVPKATGKGNSAGGGTAYNVSTITRNSAGNYTVVMSVTMASTDYWVLATVMEIGGTTRAASVSIVNTTTFTVQCQQGESGEEDADFSFAAYGVLA